MAGGHLRGARGPRRAPRACRRRVRSAAGRAARRRGAPARGRAAGRDRSRSRAVRGRSALAPETEVGGGRLVGLGTRVRHVGRLVDVDALVYDTPPTASSRSAARSATPRPVRRAFAELAATTVAAHDLDLPAWARGSSSPPAASAARTGGCGSGAGPRRSPRSATSGRPTCGHRRSSRASPRRAGCARRSPHRSARAPRAPSSSSSRSTTVDAAGFHVATQSVVAHGPRRARRDARRSRTRSSTARRAGRSACSARSPTVAGRASSAGEVRVRGAETVIAPIAVVVEEADGARRMIQPPSTAATAPPPARSRPQSRETPPGEPAVAQHLHDLQSALGELLVTGASRADRSVRDAWTSLADRTEELRQRPARALGPPRRRRARRARPRHQPGRRRRPSPPRSRSRPALELALAL